jgi:hypothetical protein
VKVKAYKIDGKTMRTLVEFAGAWINTPVGRQYCSAEVHGTINNLKRELGGFFPPEGLNKEIQHRIVRERMLQNAQIEATAKLASDPGPDEIRRREIASGSKTKKTAIS